MSHEIVQLVLLGTEVFEICQTYVQCLSSPIRDLLQHGRVLHGPIIWILEGSQEFYAFVFLRPIVRIHRQRPNPRQSGHRDLQFENVELTARMFQRGGLENRLYTGLCVRSNIQILRKYESTFLVRAYTSSRLHISNAPTGGESRRVRGGKAWRGEEGGNGARMRREGEAKRGQARRYAAICERGLTTSARRRVWAGRGGGSKKVD